MDCDVAVFGAGVAGAAAAIELRKCGRRVYLISTPTPNAEAAETLSGMAVVRLRDLGLDEGDPLDLITAFWGRNEEVSTAVAGSRVVNRARLACRLRGLAQAAGAITVTVDSLSRLERCDRGWKLSFAKNGQEVRNLRCEWIVDATGRSAAIARRLGAKREFHDELFCINTSIRTTGCATGCWTESARDGWWNLCSARDLSTVAFYSRASIIRQERKALRGQFLETKIARYGKQLIFGVESVRACGSSALNPCAGLGWLAIGDAAMTWQPLSSAGVAKALLDAQGLASALAGDPQEYRREQSNRYSRYLQQLKLHYSTETRWPSSAFWHAALALVST